ncbi:hypothetical protein [Williamwhitmania taraxaci]|uniref:Lipoprotein n=1 Tax=Williamwhitmania taraxaci TaxID=1640674 RepID=A0A1G6NDI4_9BACT|nr:hypothetical protein [Williamwhitmania taraxaci]SDC65396.1 hypothetical protein SAMN05216323_10429 [Williamwhitmania taraxaci]
MKRFLPLLLISVVLLTGGCASKRLAKQGAKFESQGLYEQAAESYYMSAFKNKDNVDALVGLKKNGQMLLDHKLIAFTKAYDGGNMKDAVYGYLDAASYKDKVSGVGVNLVMADRYKGTYDDAKSRYLSQIYPDGVLALDGEDFTKAALIFTEVKTLQPGYERSDENLVIALAEPIYREGVKSMEVGMNRKAYGSFDRIIKAHGSYKNSDELKAEARKKALIAIAVKQIEAYTKDASFAIQLQSLITGSINGLNNPFLMIVDEENRQKLINEQTANLMSNNTSIDAGRLLSANALLNCKLMEVSANTGSEIVTDVPGYIKEMVTKYDSAQRKNIQVPIYHKTRYREYTQTNSVKITLQYQLSSVESGAIMLSDVISVPVSDNTHYAIYDGDKQKLVPGYWKRIDRDSPEDAVYDNRSSIDGLKVLLQSIKIINSVDKLKSDAAKSIAATVSSKLNSYNPEGK